MAKVTKKADPKKVAKATFSKLFADFLADNGYTVEDGADFGFTEGTLVIKGDKTDVQVKFITPKAGVEHYEKVVEDEDADESADPGPGPDAELNAEYMDKEVTV